MSGIVIAESKANKWHVRYLRMAELVASWSKDPSTKTGAVIVRPDFTVVSVGFNGFPKQMVDTPEHYADRAEKYSRIVHCEVNALIHAREPLDGCALYTWPLLSCDRCAVQMIQAGICHFIAPITPPVLQERWGEALMRTKAYIEECRRTWTLVELET